MKPLNDTLFETTYQGVSHKASRTSESLTLWKNDRKSATEDSSCENSVTHYSLSKTTSESKSERQGRLMARQAKKAEMQQSGALDHFILEDGQLFAGRHLVVDVWGAKQLDDLALMRDVFETTVVRSGATLLHLHLHHFTPNGGVSAVAVLAESHISVHTWPECDFAAFDVFMCGDAKPAELVKVIQEKLSPEDIHVSQFKRGR